MKQQIQIEKDEAIRNIRRQVAVLGRYRREDGSARTFLDKESQMDDRPDAG